MNLLKLFAALGLSGAATVSSPMAMGTAVDTQFVSSTTTLSRVTEGTASIACPQISTVIRNKATETSGGDSGKQSKYYRNWPDDPEILSLKSKPECNDLETWLKEMFPRLNLSSPSTDPEVQAWLREINSYPKQVKIEHEENNKFMEQVTYLSRNGLPDNIAAFLYSIDKMPSGRRKWAKAIIPVCLLEQWTEIAAYASTYKRTTTQSMMAITSTVSEMLKRQDGKQNMCYIDWKYDPEIQALRDKITLFEKDRPGELLLGLLEQCYWTSNPELSSEDYHSQLEHFREFLAQLNILSNEALSPDATSEALATLDKVSPQTSAAIRKLIPDNLELFTKVAAYKVTRTATQSTTVARSHTTDSPREDVWMRAFAALGKFNGNPRSLDVDQAMRGGKLDMTAEELQHAPPASDRETGAAYSAWIVSMDGPRYAAQLATLATFSHWTYHTGKWTPEIAAGAIATWNELDPESRNQMRGFLHPNFFVVVRAAITHKVIVSPPAGTSKPRTYDDR